MGKTKRIQLLTDAEISDIYDRPNFSLEERHRYFTLDQTENVILNQHQNYRTRTHFILLLGYFKAKQQFFNIHFEDVFDDVIIYQRSPF